MSLLVTPQSPSPDPPTLRTASTKSCSTDEEGRLKTNGRVSVSFEIDSYYEVTIESRYKCLTVGGEKECRFGCDVGTIHGGIPHGLACPLVGGAHGGS
jgi:hypothetical protein